MAQGTADAPHFLPAGVIGAEGFVFNYEDIQIGFFCGRSGGAGPEDHHAPRRHYADNVFGDAPKVVFLVLGHGTLLSCPPSSYDGIASVD